MIHIILLPLFPLLAVAAWILLREDRSPLGWAGRVLAVVFVPFYTALDAISGISAGTLQKVGGSAEQLNALFATGRPLGQVGGYAFLAAIVLILGSTWLAGQRSWLFWVAAVILITAGYLFTTSHIYWPKGVIAMLGFAVGFFMLRSPPLGRPERGTYSRSCFEPHVGVGGELDVVVALNSVENAHGSSEPHARDEPDRVSLRQLLHSHQFEAGAESPLLCVSKDIRLCRAIEDPQAGARREHRIASAEYHGRGRTLEHIAVARHKDHVVSAPPGGLAQHRAVHRVAERLRTREQPRRGLLDVVPVAAVESHNADALGAHAGVVGRVRCVHPAAWPAVALDPARHNVFTHDSSSARARRWQAESLAPHIEVGRRHSRVAAERAKR